MKLCDRCRISGCCLNYLGEACKRARKRECPDVVYTNADELRDMTDEEMEDQLVLKMEGVALCKMFVAIPTGEMFLSRDAAKEAVGKWLRQPAEGE